MFLIDCKNLLKNFPIEIDYQGVGNNSQFSYDGRGNKVKILETRSNSVISTQNFVFSGFRICEERDSGGTLTKTFFSLGQTTGGTTTKYFYGLTHRRDVCTVTDNSGNTVTELAYDDWGRGITLLGSFKPDFTYANMYFHESSGMNLTRNRAYSAAMSRWLSRDPYAERGGLNLFAYVSNNPITFVDPTGSEKSDSGGNSDCKKCPPRPEGPPQYMNPDGSQTWIFGDGSYAHVFSSGSYRIHFNTGGYVYCDENGNVVHWEGGKHENPNPPPDPPGSYPPPEPPPPDPTDWGNPPIYEPQSA